jgi:hypothetical protein
MNRWLLAAVVFSGASVASAASPAVSVEQILQFKPHRSDVDVDTPTGADIKKCRVDSEQRGKSSGWVLFGPQGEVLRRFIDSNADDTVDEFRYFNQGMEVYRELDTNANKVIDQYRWLGTAGTRWGVDSDEDGKIDRWLVLSAEEATLEAVNAMSDKDAVSLQGLVVTQDDVRALGISDKVGEKLLASVKDVPGKVKAVTATTKILKSTTSWDRFDCSNRLPSVFGASPGKWDRDLFVYENAMAIVTNGTESGFVQIGELVRVGDVWKLTRVPLPIEGNDVKLEGGILLQESLDAGTLSTGSEGLPPAGQKLVAELKALDDKAPAENAAQKEIETYNLARADILARLARAVTSDEEKDIWWRQLIEGVAAESYKGMFPGGAARLTAIEDEVEKAGLVKLVPFTRFRRLLVEFADKMQAAKTTEDRQKIQEAHLQSLRDFVEKFPKSEEAPEAMWQVATTIEFNGNAKDADTWYKHLAKEYGSSPAGIKAKGAVNRLNLKGEELKLSGPRLGGQGTVDVSRMRGKVVAVVYWAMTFKPSVDEMPQLVELYNQYHDKGFEIVGVNLDSPDAPVTDFLRQQKSTWPQIQDAGGIDSGRASTDFGITSPSTMFLVGKDGKVISSSASLDDLKKLVPDLLKK